VRGSALGDRVDPQVLKVALVLIVGALAVVFDTTIVSVALRSLAVELSTSVARRDDPARGLGAGPLWR
jgi:hypothetical protein